MGHLVARFCAAVGVAEQTISPHSLRHTFVRRGLRQGGSVVVVSRLLGHASIQTTQRYVDYSEGHGRMLPNNLRLRPG